MSRLVELARELRSVYQHPPSGKRTVEVHLFGIRHAEALAAVSLKQLVEAAGIPDTYHTEIAKGRALAPYVTVKP